MTDIEQLKQLLIEKNAILFLGAGFSYGSENEFGKLPKGDDLKKELFSIFIDKKIENEYLKEIEGYNLQEMCQIIEEPLIDKREELVCFLKKKFKGAQPQDFHYKLTSYPWKKIYTVNIDDLVERIFLHNECKLTVQNTEKQKNVEDDSTEYIKLHGCVNSKVDDLVFSKKDYKNLITSSLNFKLNSLVSDIHCENIIFVGASLEEDIDYYISLYEKAGHFSKGKFFFIDPYPTFKLKQRVAALGGILIKWSTEKFLNYVHGIHYNPSEQEKMKKRLNYHGFYLLDDIISSLNKKKIYESKLYEGFNSRWEDAIDDWIFNRNEFDEIVKFLKNLSFKDYNTYCYSIYGGSFTGKDCLLKLIGLHMRKENYHVIEFNGKHFDINVLDDYIRNSIYDKYVLLIENASFYYRLIEMIMKKKLGNKKLIIITTSRSYYHSRKKYYLEGNPYTDFKLDDRINIELAKKIFSKLKQKGYLGELPRDEKRCIPIIKRKSTIINLLTDLTYGEGFRKNIGRTISKISKSSEQIKSLYIDLLIFDKADLPYYPGEMLTSRYSFNYYNLKYNNTNSIDVRQSTFNDENLLDFIKEDSNGLSIKNNLLMNELWDIVDKDKKIESIISTLKWISKYVSEKVENYWRIIFESILKEDILKNNFDLSIPEILEIYYSVKDYYNDISFYWLQLGIAEQKQNHYEKALNHLKMATTIRPHAYQIQHAIARNYLKHANYIDDEILSHQLFKMGESKMKKLIYSDEFSNKKAKSFSIHCYVHEKIHNIQKFDDEITNTTVKELKKLIDEIIEEQYIGIGELVSEFMVMLKEKNKLSVITFKQSDKYSLMGMSTIIQQEQETFDSLIESY